MVKPLTQKEGIQEQQTIVDTNPEITSLKLGVKFKLLDAIVEVKQIDLPRLTLQLTNHKQLFNPKYKGHILSFGGHDFLVKAITGQRLYLILVEIDGNKVEENKNEPL